MAMATKDWDYRSTHCMRTGKPCSPGTGLARCLAQGVDRGAAAIPAAFQLTGVATVRDCVDGCQLTFRVDRDAVWIFGGIAQHRDAEALVGFAQGFFGAGDRCGVQPAHYPVAMVRAMRDGSGDGDRAPRWPGLD